MLLFYSKTLNIKLLFIYYPKNFLLTWLALLLSIEMTGVLRTGNYLFLYEIMCS